MPRYESHVTMYLSSGHSTSCQPPYSSLFGAAGCSNDGRPPLLNCMSVDRIIYSIFQRFTPGMEKPHPPGIYTSSLTSPVVTKRLTSTIGGSTNVGLREHILRASLRQQRIERQTPGQLDRPLPTSSNQPSFARGSVNSPSPAPIQFRYLRFGGNTDENQVPIRHSCADAIWLY